MADERLLITIEGKDGVSKTFVAVSKSAETAGKSVEASGKTGGKAMKELAQETERTAKSAEDLGRKYAAVGAAIGTGLGVISKLGASFRDQRLDLQSLEDQYGTSADAVIDFTEAIQDSFNQSNDAARDSALTFATLYRNYEMGEQQIITLMERTADISSARGRNMTETSQMIQNALRGEAEYIEQIGVTLNDTYVASEYAARGLGNWNTVTDEAAKAQFRYVLLMEQTADTQGRAAEEAERAGGLMRRWINEAQDAGQAVGGMLGPLGEMGAEFSQIAIGLPIVAAGFGKVIGSVQGSARAMSLLSLATGPVGALTLGVGLLSVAFLQNQKEAAESAAVIATLKDAYLDLQVAATNARTDGNTQQAAYLDQLRFQVESVRAEADLVYQTLDDASQFDFRGVEYSREEWFALKDAYEITEEEADRLAATQQRLGMAFQDSGIDGERLAAEVDRLYLSFVRGEITADEYALSLEVLSQNTSAYAVVVEDAAFAQGLLNEALADGKVTAEEFATVSKAIGIIAQENAELNRRGYRDAEASNRERRKTFDLWVEELSYIGRIGFATRQHTALQLELNAVGEESNRGHRTTTDLMREQASATQLLGMDTRDYATAAVEASEATEAWRQALVGSASALGQMGLDEFTTTAEDFNEHIEAVTDNLERLLSVSGFEGLADAATDMRMFAMETERAGASLDTIYRVAVGNTDAIANQSQAIADWAEELIGVQGEYSKLDELVQNGRITGQSGVFDDNSEYAQAQRAYNDIARENAEIQEHMLVIQAKQAPLIRDQMSAYEDYLNVVADMPAEQQLVALGWMDATASARAMEFQTLAVAAATGQLGENGEEVFTSMVTGAAQADPVLKALLLDMGLIEEGADGTISVNLDGVSEGKSEIALLTDSINDLNDTLIKIHIEADGSAAEETITRTKREYDDIDGKTATGYLNADGSPATTQIGIVDESLDALDGSTAWVYAEAQDNASSVLSTLANTWGGVIATSWIDVVTRNVPGKAEGGVIGYAGGGTIPVELAEAGGEVIHFASGGTAYVGQRGIYSLSPGDFVQPHNAVSNSYGGTTVNVHVAGSVVTERELTHTIGAAISEALAAEYGQRRAGFGEVI